jgi:CobQ-like glutamine amidotransferase family enzyme
MYVAAVAVVLQYLQNTSADEGNVFVLKYKHSTSADIATVVIVLQYWHSTSAEVATVVVLHDCTTLEMLLLWLLYCCTCTVVQQK